MRASIIMVALATVSLYSCASSAMVAKPETPPQLRAENAATPGYLDVKVSGIPLVQGQLFVELYDAQSYFKYELVLNERIVPVTGTNITVRLEHVPSGRYIVVASQDANMNHKLDANFFGVPTEAYGFSRNARNPLGIPKFEEGAIDFDGSALLVEVAVRL